MKKAINSLAVILGLGVAAALPAFTTGCAGDSYHKSTGEVLDDAAITTKVKADLLADRDTKGLAVKVKTYRGEVQLSGFVNSAGEKARAGEIARGVKGVQWVRNDIVVK